ncbi:hypothetical protein vBVpPvVp04M_00010 [Vibrio phage vB_Vp_PvVp04_M]|nr:hypothetical protein vBVpPvVp04M_00010 [Vibrio phage vB_Vp_PvVp04_M]
MKYAIVVVILSPLTQRKVTMSYTEIYSIGNEHCCKIGEIKNTHRGAMFVWNQIAQKYFNLERFPFFDEEMQMRIWNAGNERDLTNAELIVLSSTMDNVTVKASDIDRLVTAFEEYAKDNPNSSMGEQAAIIKEAELLPEYKIAWCQTSVCSFAFYPEYDEETDEYTYSELSNSWDLFEQFDKLHSKGK